MNYYKIDKAMRHRWQGKGDNMSKIKRAFTLFLVAVILSSFIGFFISISYYANPKNVLPLYRINDIQVDFAGNIYIGLEHFRIQVFDKEGNCLYPICFNNLGGAFLFYVNSENGVDIYSTSDYMQYSFFKEEMLTENKIDTNLRSQTKSLFLSLKQPAKTYHDKEGNKYNVIDNEVFITRNALGSTTKIHFKTPLIPLRPHTHILIGNISVLLIALFNHKALYKLFSSIKRPN